MNLVRWLLAYLLLCLPPLSIAQTLPKDFAHNVKGKILLLRGKYVENELTFNSEGNIIGDATPGPFSVSAIEISKDRLSSDSLELEGYRATLIYTGKSEPVQTADIKFIHSAERVHIVIKLDPAHPEGLGQLLAKIFATSVDDALSNKTWAQRNSELFTVGSLASQTPGQSPISPSVTRADSGSLASPDNPFGLSTQKISAEQEKLSAVYSPSDRVTAPHMIHSVNPAFSDYARKKKISGICIVSLIVDKDGFPIHIRMVRSLDPSLDQNAIAAVSQYRFAPAMHHLHPVAVEVNIEVSFKIY